MKITTAYVGTDETIIGHDPEYAEMGNPSGARYGKRDFIIAETASGARFIHERSFEVGDPAASRLVALIVKAGVLNLQHWNQTYDIYGSAAWQTGEREREMAWQSDPSTAGSIRDF